VDWAVVLGQVIPLFALILGVRKDDDSRIGPYGDLEKGFASVAADKGGGAGEMTTNTMVSTVNRETEGSSFCLSNPSSLYALLTQLMTQRSHNAHSLMIDIVKRRMDRALTETIPCRMACL
jgi:hypothetical protein